MRPELPVADRPQRRQVRIEVAARNKATTSSRKSGVHHGVEARREPRGQRRTIARSPRITFRVERSRPAQVLLLARRQRLAGQPDHFQRPLDALESLTRMRRGGDADRASPAPHAAPAIPARAARASSLGAQGRIGLGQQRQAATAARGNRAWCRRPAAAPCPGRGCRPSAARHRARTAPPSTARKDPGCRRGDAVLARGCRGPACRCRCPCRGTRAPNRR